MGDMTGKVFESHRFGKAALKKMGQVPENFRLYHAEWLDVDGDYMAVTGAEFRVAKRGKNKGKLSIKVDGTDKRVIVTGKEIEEQQ